MQLRLTAFLGPIFGYPSPVFISSAIVDAVNGVLLQGVLRAGVFIAFAGRRIITVITGRRLGVNPSVVGTRIDAIVFRLGFPRLANFRAVIANRAGWIIIALAGNGIALTGNGAAVAAGHGAIPAVFSAGGNTGAVITADTRIFTAHITFRNQIGEHRANIALAAYLLSFNVFAESVRFPGPGVGSASSLRVY